jgi:hypothetical protein
MFKLVGVFMDKATRLSQGTTGHGLSLADSNYEQHSLGTFEQQI